MKIIQILSGPAVQILSFCIILVGSPEFGGPYGFFLYHALLEAYVFAVIGVAGIIITALSFINNGKKVIVIQFIGALTMIASLLVFFFSSDHFMNMYAFTQIIPLLTLFLFIAIVALITRRFFRMYN